MRHLFFFFLAGPLAIAAVAQAQTYIGAERCGQCHEFAYQSWLASGHARAHQTLTPEQLGDSKCNTCHTVVGENSVVSNAPKAGTTKLLGVQCESCHGGGKLYQPAYVMKDADLARAVGLVDPTPANCQLCHTEGAPSITPFDFKAMWARIDHGKEARLKWEKARNVPGKQASLVAPGK